MGGWGSRVLNYFSDNTMSCLYGIFDNSEHIIFCSWKFGRPVNLCLIKYRSFATLLPFLAILFKICSPRFPEVDGRSHVWCSPEPPLICPHVPTLCPAPTPYPPFLRYRDLPATYSFQSHICWIERILVVRLAHVEQSWQADCEDFPPFLRPQSL